MSFSIPSSIVFALDGALLAALLGLLVGSFCNVVILRMPQMLMQEDAPSSPPPSWGLVKPRSHCPSCLHPLRPKHLIPVFSFFWLKGRCAFCAQSISPRYWKTELMVCAWWVFCAVKFHVLSLLGQSDLATALFLSQWASALLWAMLGSALICLAQIDWEHQLLPDAITQPFLWLGLLSAHFGLLGLSPKSSLLGAVIGYMSFWLVANIYLLLSSREGLGQGDMKLLALLGAWMGPMSLIPLVLLASTSGALFGLWRLKVSKDLDIHEPIAFGPFLILGAFTLLIVGPHHVLEFLALSN